LIVNGFNVFRGLIAPASLKPVFVRTRRAAGKVRFPGLDCPGLIEADNKVFKWLGMDNVFRGLIAPASLKRRSTIASLLSRVGFPGLDCPGLIEARRPD